MLFLKRSGGQSQFSTVLQTQSSSIPAIERVQRWCHENPAGDLRVSTLAKKAAMSERSLQRAFREDIGCTPAKFVSALRLQSARCLLEETSLALKTVARRSGLGSVAATRRAFLRELGVSPLEYRKKFQAEAAGAAGRVEGRGSPPMSNPAS